MPLFRKSPPPVVPASAVQQLIDDADPFGAMCAIMRNPAHQHTILLGLSADASNLALSNPRRNVGIMGAPRANKTAGSAVPAVAVHPGPAVVLTTRGTEFINAVGILRARVAGPDGHLYHLDLGGAPALGGCTECGWSPVSTTWRRALAVARAMTEAINVGQGLRGGGFWEIGGTSILAPFLYAAGLDGRGMEWVLTQIKNQAIEDAMAILSADESNRAALTAADDLGRLKHLPADTRGGQWATAQTALAPYSSLDALEATERPLLDAGVFVAGRPDVMNPWLKRTPPQLQGHTISGVPIGPLGCSDTLFITGSALAQRLLGTLFVGVLTDIREARFSLAEADEAASNYARPTTMVMADDMAQLPDADAPSTLATGAGSGLVTVATFHDEAALRARWRDDGEGMITSFGELLVYRGVRDPRTLERLSMLCGTFWQELVGSSESVSNPSSRVGYMIGGGAGPSKSESLSTSFQLIPRMQSAEINMGDPGSDNRYTNRKIMSFGPNGWSWVWSTPYYAEPLWIAATMMSTDFLLRQHHRRFGALSLPTLDRYNTRYVAAAARAMDGVNTETFLMAQRNLKSAWETGDPRFYEWLGIDTDDDDNDDPPAGDGDDSLVPA